MAKLSSKNASRYAAVAVAAIVAVLGARHFVGGSEPDDRALAQQAGFLTAAGSSDGPSINSYVSPEVPRLRQPTAVKFTATAADATVPDEPLTPSLSRPQIAVVPEDLGRLEYVTEAEAQAAIAASRAANNTQVASITPAAPAALAPQVTRSGVSPAMEALAVPLLQAQPDATDNGQDSCTPEFDVTSAPGGMAAVVVNAPCHAGHSLILGHAGLVVDAEIGPDGQLAVSFPVLDNRQPFTATLDNGLSAQTSLTVPSAAAFEHVVLQWQGDAGFQLHALEFGADYGDAGHVWVGDPKSPARGVRGEGGFLTHLGDPKVGGVGEVYSYPVGKMEGEGSIDLTVEAEVTTRNCGSDITGQVLQRTHDGDIASVDVTFAVPDCDAVGEILVLKNILQAMKIAAN